MSELTDKEREVLREIDEVKWLSIPSRKSPDYKEDDREKLLILKQLVYKNLIAYDCDFSRMAFVFLSRKHYPDFS